MVRPYYVSEAGIYVCMPIMKYKPSLLSLLFNDIFSLFNYTASFIRIELTASRTLPVDQLIFVGTDTNTFVVLHTVARYRKQAFLLADKRTLGRFGVELFSFSAFQYQGWTVTYAEAINVRILRINDVLKLGLVCAFDDCAVRADLSADTRDLLMAVDVVVRAKVNCVYWPNTEMELPAIVRVGKISVSGTRESGIRLAR
jgi:hypothetical protein